MQFIFYNNQDSKEEKKTLDPYIDHCRKVIETKDYTSLESSLCLPSDTKNLAVVDNMVQQKKTPELKYIIVIGIGGSNLGAKAVYDALYGDIDLLSPERYPKMIFLDTTDPEFLHSFSIFIEKYVDNKNEVLVSIISKSGGTTEIIANAEIMIHEFKKKFASWKERVVVITDENSPLWSEAQRLQLSVLAIPKNVGGRYSVFSAVGLFPLAVAGINIQQLLKGAEEMMKKCSEDSRENPALNSGIFQFTNYKKGRTTHNSYFFHRELESLGKWYRQLTGESLGKKGKGITPIISMGSVDHHSMIQLYLGGIDDKSTEFIYTQESVSYPIPSVAQFPSLNRVAGKETSQIITAIVKGTIIAYQNIGRPFFEVIFEKMNCYELGSYMQYKMMEIMYLAQLFEVNAFDQPQVELYKIETKRILESK